MANEIKVVYITGRTITYGAYHPDGTVRTAAGTALTETAGTGFYDADDAAILAGDTVIVKESTTIIGSAEYQPDTTSINMRGTDNAATETKQDAMQVDVDTIAVDVAGLDGDAMRGTDDAATEVKQDIMQTSIDNIPTVAGGTPELK
jgi:hypothetical protein